MRSLQGAWPSSAHLPARMPGSLLALALVCASLELAWTATSTPALTPIHRTGYCSFYGECGRNPEVNISLFPTQVPCLDNGPARNMSGLHLAALRRVCPMLEGSQACCSLGQLNALEASLALSGGVLARCPACARNFATLHCHNICSPDQSLFTNVTRVFARSGIAAGSFAVLEYDGFYQQSFASDAYTSCRNVRLPATGGYAIAAMCGKYGVTLCNPQRWLDFQGDTSNGLAPLRIRFHLIPDSAPGPGDGMKPLGAATVACQSPVEAGSEPCSCQDCPAACPPLPPLPEPPEPFHVGVMDGDLFVACVLFAGLSVTFLAWRGWCCWQRRASKPPAPKPQKKERERGMKCTEAAQARLGAAFQFWGELVASYPGTVLAVAAAATLGCCSGLAFLELVTDPVELWAAPGSDARQEKAFHDRHFGPFFRTNQVFLTAPGLQGESYHSLLLGEKNFSGVLSQPVLLKLLELQERLRDVMVWAPRHGHNVTLADVCYAPLNPEQPGPSDCCVNSLAQYFQSNRTRLLLTAPQSVAGKQGTVDWRDHFLYCVNSPLSFKDITNLELSCMADYGAPVFPFLAVGGYSGEEYSEAEALVLTFSLNNYHRDDPRFEWALLWEQRFLEILQDFQREHAGNLSVAYMAERSLEDEINRTTAEDLPIFAISYLVVFLYIALALGSYNSCRHILVDSKMTLGLGGVLVVLCAVGSAMGLCAYMGLPSSLIIVEVLPFLLLAVGADNIFIFVLELQRSERGVGESREQHIGRILGNVAPSMLLCSLSEAVCFFLGALTQMPAVRSFALSAGVAVVLDFLLQISAFVALVALDARRQEAGRWDMCCCCSCQKGQRAWQDSGLLRPLMRRYYAPALLHRRMRPVVMLLFFFLFCAGLYFTLQLEVGLDQELALPEDSYLLQYFEALNQYFMVGVPTFFITTSGYNFSLTAGIDGVCSSTGCDNNSLMQKIQYAAEFPNVSYLAIPATSWVDDFLDWLNPTSGCCRIHVFGPKKGQFCPATDSSLSCLLGKCQAGGTSGARPSPTDFDRFLPWFLGDRPTLQCPKGGLGAYNTAVDVGPGGEILASRFMAYHTPLRNSQEFTAALAAARALAANITASMRRVPGTDPSFRVFPYSLPYVFYEQYLSIVGEGLFTLGLCLVPTFAVSCLLLGLELRLGLANLVAVLSVLVTTGGAMALWSIPYNAVALVNLVATVGISVEFTSHITRSFAISTRPGRLERAKEATVDMGSAVVAGVAMTNLPGIVVLAFARARLVQIFFFRLNLIVTLLGLVHGLVLLPVLLSYFGPPPLMSLSSVKTLTSSSPGTQPPEDPSKDPPTSPQA
ncbi:NPC1-like intracellular cholesterol transporter 1 [Alligator mississippiensis]|uniref:NPC1-like intracellular cholesterol transporter 1 n=1 Tax=Alligator mississippiensis TaxID=8496 RepID=UPI002877818F|nr:NPC1-like intracellular cholesterol transporter 1 [Alligator mississippiensis]